MNALHIFQLHEDEELEEQQTVRDITPNGLLLGAPELVEGSEVENSEEVLCEEELELMKVDKRKLVVKELYLTIELGESSNNREGSSAIAEPISQCNLLREFALDLDHKCLFQLRRLDLLRTSFLLR